MRPADMEGLYLYYYVIFKADLPTESYSPVVTSPFRVTLGGGGHIHGFDPEMSPILPALWYCLHLPRHGLDTVDLSPKAISVARHVPHNIVAFPSYGLSGLVDSNLIRREPPTLLISDDSCYEAACSFAAQVGVALGVVQVSQLSDQMLQNHWAAIAAWMRGNPKRPRSLLVKPVLLPDTGRIALPLTFTANQFEMTTQLLTDLQSKRFSRRLAFSAAVQLSARVNTLVELEEKNLTNPTKAEFLEAHDRHLKAARVPLVLTMPGRAPRQRPRGSGAASKILGARERNAIELLGVHRAAARGGVWWDSGTIPGSLFKELHRLEDHCRASRPANRFVWDSMKRIGEHVANLLGSDGLTALGVASHVTAFADFPIGLAVLPETGDPLCCIKPISYRPLTPLTRALQFELNGTAQHYIGRGFKVVVAECLSKEDRIRPLSDAAWKFTLDMFSTDRRVQVVYKDVQSVEALKGLVAEHRDAEILVISAHGHYSDDHNFAGLWVGKDLWLATDDDIHVPPVVILSACHVAPRGLGAVSVADLLVRAGAVAVLGTLIPVDVRRNATLMCRLFVYIAEALSGSAQFRSLDQAWQWVVASNAIHEILSASDALEEWGHTRPSGKLSPMEEFKLHRANGRLRTGHIYSDTVSIVREMAAESGLSQYLDAVLSSQGFFPESCFYVMIGSPETIILHDPLIGEVLDGA